MTEYNEELIKILIGEVLERYQEDKFIEGILEEVSEEYADRMSYNTNKANNEILDRVYNHCKELIFG